MEFLKENELLNRWQEIGEKNIWIRDAIDPIFTKQMLKKCDSILQLYHFLKEAGWCLGQGFYYQTICFINQSNGGDEWLTIKGFRIIDTNSFDGIEHKRFCKKIEALLNQ